MDCYKLLKYIISVYTLMSLDKCMPPCHCYYNQDIEYLLTPKAKKNHNVLPCTFADNYLFNS